MGREINRLTARQVASATAFGRHADGDGLFLYVAKDGSRRWVYLYQERGRRRELGFGPAAGPNKSGLTLAEARRKAEEARRLRREGLDPRDASPRRKAANKPVTLGAFADSLVEDIAKGFRNPKHADQWRRTFKIEAKAIRNRPINEIATDDVLRVLKPMWTKTPETAGRVRGRIERILYAAKARGLREGDNPARWDGHLRELLPRLRKLTRGHHAAIPYQDAPAFMAKLRKHTSVSALALEFCILTAARTGEVRGARFCEFDLDNPQGALWVIPKERMKAGKEHRAPLTERAAEVVRDLMTTESTAESFVFPGAKKGTQLSVMSLLQCVRGIRPGCTTHGFRSCFRDWAGDTTGFSREIAEAALAHTIQNATEAAYRRSDALEKRRKLMDAWAAYLAAPRDAKVLPFRNAAAE
ncbi:MAG: site-specific integrase [Pseudonocardiaceae bacterium]|nr:MAG: site-specific integrase [Pseudonocardiaceae bacterium]